MKQVPYTRKKCAGIELILMQPRWRIYIYIYHGHFPCRAGLTEYIRFLFLHFTKPRLYTKVRFAITIMVQSGQRFHTRAPSSPLQFTLNSKLCTPRPKKCINCLFQLLAPLPPTFRPLPLT
jgi:hypothetical protein